MADQSKPNSSHAGNPAQAEAKRRPWRLAVAVAHSLHALMGMTFDRTTLRT
jgi:hypothetical protein